MVKTKEELLQYALKMRERGDTYRSVINYLNRNTDDEGLKKEIIQEVDRLEKENPGKNQLKPGSDSPSKFSIIMGVLFLGFGAILIPFLWNKGFISTIPFILIGIGVTALVGLIK